MNKWPSMLAMARTWAGRHPTGRNGELERDDEGDSGGVEGTISFKTRALKIISVRLSSSVGALPTECSRACPPPKQISIPHRR